MVRSALTVPEKAEIWRAYRAGASLRSISRTLGRTMEALRTLVAATGGRHPAGAAPVRTMAGAGGAGRDLPGDRGGAFMSADRRAHQARRIDRVSIRYRQERGSPPLPRGPGGAGSPSRARRPTAAQLVACPRLRQVVEAKLASRWSPQQIAGWLTRA
jgi:hypothetical protein